VMADDARDLVLRISKAVSAIGGLQAYDAPDPEGDPSPTDLQRRMAQGDAFALALRRLGALTPASLYVDLGAGSGHVAHRIRSALPAECGARFLLVDQQERGSPGEAADVLRVQADMDKITSWPMLQALAGDGGGPAPEAEEVAVVANHLCGSAIDRSIDVFGAEPRVRAFLAATCCHDRLRWESYCNRPFFERLGFNREDFHRMAAWTALAPRRNRPPEDRVKVLAASDLTGLPPAACERLGLSCRALVDAGRCARLADLGMRAELAKHVSFRMTADNVMIKAWRP